MCTIVGCSTYTFLEHEILTYEHTRDASLKYTQQKQCFIQHYNNANIIKIELDTEPINIIKIDEITWKRVMKQLSTTVTR